MTTTYLKDYKPANFAILTTDLIFDLFEDKVIVTNTMSFKRLAAGDLVLNAENLEILEILCDNKTIDYQYSNDIVTVKNCKDNFILVVKNIIKPKENKALSGLYYSNKLFCTQCEAEGFRRITCYLDRPDVLSIFTVTIIADKNAYPTLLSNGNLVDSGNIDDNRHWVKWQDPFKKPCYLFALVAGKFDVLEDKFITHSNKTIDLYIYVEQGYAQYCLAAMQSLKNAMAWDEKHYGREYDLQRFMIVAVRDFNMGAMENKGLNIFNTKYILASTDTATDDDYLGIESVVGHEYFHNWTGNRVTCRDWFQLSLKEGLTVFRDQSFSHAMGLLSVKRIQDVIALRKTQFPEDAGAMAHPVRPDSYEEINNFYTATIYNKGAEVIRMQRTLVGVDGFRKGMDLYFKRHDGSAVTIDDFVCAIADANSIDLTQFKLWYTQAGTPILKVHSEYKENKLFLEIEQSCRATPECSKKLPFYMPIKCALFKENGELILEKLLILKEQKQSFVFENIASKPVLSLLRDFSAPVVVQYGLSIEDLLILLQFETDGFARWEAGQKLMRDSIITNYNNLIKKDTSIVKIDDRLVKAYERIIENVELENMSLSAELLEIPCIEDLAMYLNNIDIIALEESRYNIQKALAAKLWDKMHDSYQKFHSKSKADFKHAYAIRKWCNILLQWMMRAYESKTIAICYEQYKNANNMTESLASFALLVQSLDKNLREEALQDFYKKWQDEDLVVNKWFTAQAIVDNENTLSHIKELLQHKDFEITNPNRVRALIGAFCNINYKQFHALDCSGYKFLTQMLLEIDKFNPQVAARLATPFSRWQKLDKVYQDNIKKELEILSKHKLSKDLCEIVQKSLVV